MYYWRIYNFVTEMRFAVRKSTAFVKNKKRKHCKINVSASYMRAADGNRTRDLRTTNATLYRLSHSHHVTANAITVIHSNKRDTVCQQQKLQILTVFVDEKKLTQNLRKVKYKQM